MPEQIERMRIPDEDVTGWMQTLREGGFSDEEIEGMLVHLNQEYAQAKKEAYVEAELTNIKNQIFERSQRVLSEAELDALRKGILSRFE